MLYLMRWIFGINYHLPSDNPLVDYQTNDSIVEGKCNMKLIISQFMIYDFISTSRFISTTKYVSLCSLSVKLFETYISIEPK